jgi:hypothetical protein
MRLSFTLEYRAPESVELPSLTSPELLLLYPAPEQLRDVLRLASKRRQTPRGGLYIPGFLGWWFAGTSEYHPFITT